MAKEGISVVMSFKKETPGTWVFKNDDDGAAISQLYIRKDALNGTKVNSDTTITVAVTVN